MQILVISAHLKRSDVELWAKAGQLAVELSNLSLASRCYQQGLRRRREGGVNACLFAPHCLAICVNAQYYVVNPRDSRTCITMFIVHASCTDFPP